MERWPPVYDAEQLTAQIKDLAARGDLIKKFYVNAPERVAWCQGDVIALPKEVPVLRADGAAVAESEGLAAWLLLSNTCDLDRSLDRVPWAQAVPIFELGGREDVSDVELQALRRYSQSRRFYVPDWLESEKYTHRFADLTMPVTVAREALEGAARLARLSLAGWVLLHSCLVRFLARDDGRFD